MGMIPREIIDDVLDRLDIVEVISDYVQLKRAGRNFKACCPFHNEKTPSFVVSPDKQIYHCFGCHAGGNVIDFVMKHDSLEFPEAVKILASKAGVELPKTGGPGEGGESLSSKIIEANKAAGVFFQNVLRSEKGKKAREYLSNRGITPETATRFAVGYAPRDWEALSSYCRSRKITGEVLKKSGLTVSSEKGKGDYDRFRDRVMFPIHNERGVIVAFGGRVLDDKLPKYINSPETPVYSKSNVLYGLHFSRKGIKEKGYAILVEGYLDVIIPFQNGVDNVVATSGTALTLRQVELLKKYTDTAVMVFDSDQAGENASLRGLDILLENGMKIKIATLPEGDDPDSFVRREGSSAFYGKVENSKSLFDYKLDILIQKKGKRDIAAIVDGMLPTIAKVTNAVLQSDYLRQLAEKLGVHEASLRVEIGKIKPDKPYRSERPSDTAEQRVKFRSSEIHLLGLMMTDRSIFDAVENELGMTAFTDVTVQKVLKEIRLSFDSEGEDCVNPGKLLSRFGEDENARALIIQAMAKADIITEPLKAMRDCIACVRRENREDRLRDLAATLKTAQERSDAAGINAALKMIDQIHKERVV